MEQAQTQELGSIDPAFLDEVTGAGWKRVVARVIPGLNAGLALYDGYSEYSSSREKGKGVGESLLDGAGSALSTFTYYDLWGSRPAY